jgi:hypothetical protein
MDSFDIQMGTNKLVRRNITIRGIDGPVSFPIWDYVDRCTEDCVVAEQCQYKMVGNCKVQYQYMRTVLELVQNEFVNTNSEQLFHIGMHLIPLYRGLCKMKLVEASLKSLQYSTAQGGLRIHPIYKEIREQLKLIDDTWKNLQLKKESVKSSEVPSYEWMTGDGEPVTVLNNGVPLSDAVLAGAAGMAKEDEDMLPDMGDSVQVPIEDCDDSPMGELLAKKPAVKKKKDVVPLKWKK